MELVIENYGNGQKIPNSGYTAEEKRIALLKEIEVLESIKSSYFYFLATSLSSDYPECILTIETNMDVVKKNLSILYFELQSIGRIVRNPTPVKIKIIDLAYNENEIEAIQLFNSDKRFSINE